MDLNHGICGECVRGIIIYLSWGEASGSGNKKQGYEAIFLIGMIFQVPSQQLEALEGHVRSVQISLSLDMQLQAATGNHCCPPSDGASP